MKVDVINCISVGLEVLDVRTEAAGEERGHKSLSCLGDDVVVKVFPAGIGFFVVHGQRLVDRFRGVTRVPRVDGDAGTETTVAVRASKL